MPHWIILNLNFKDCEKIAAAFKNEALPQKRPTGIYKELILYLKSVVDSSAKLINRYFYLFEPDPHLFLVLEAKSKKYVDVIRARISRIKKPDFIEPPSIKLNTGDGGHSGAVLDFFHAAAKFAFFRASQEYKPGYYNNDEVKLVHCFGNPVFGLGYNELLFYLKCAYFRGLPPGITKKCLKAVGFPEKNIEKFLRWDLKKKKF